MDADHPVEEYVAEIESFLLTSSTLVVNKMWHDPEDFAVQLWDQIFGAVIESQIEQRFWDE